ncbi:MAG TPA: CerR family C-terminal domain-containing protein [Steroidobacteraceae bacterium]|nr:CerR family C-terminal domain-containing protein [Steroidobacteraceae bacterium]
MKQRNIARRDKVAAATAVRRPARRGARGTAARSLRTRAQLIEVAGQIFSEHGFDGATGQDICRRAGVHTAAIVYHFGGMARLYRAVLVEANRRLVTTEAIATAVKAETDPRRRLEAFLGMIVGALTSPASQTWAGRLFGREFVMPSAVYGSAHDRALAARAKMLKSIVGALTGRPPNDPQVARACVSTIAPCALLLLVNRRKLKRILPGLNLDADAAPQLTRHLVDFALAGLGAIAARRAGL